MPDDPHKPSCPASDAPVENSASTSTAPVAPPEGSGCPTPLAWNQVLKEFQSQSEVFEVQTNGLTTRGRILGEGTPLYFLNGISATPALFCLTVWLLRDEFRCVVLDFPSEADSLDDLVDSLGATATELGDEQFDLYATSFGSTVALKALSGMPQRILHTVLQGPMISMKLSIAERLASNTLRLFPGPIGRLPLRNTVLQNNHRRWFPPFDITRWQFLLQDTGDVPTRVVAKRAGMLHGLDLTGELQRLQTPALIISSEGEAVRHREAADTLARQLPNSHHEVLSNTGHVPFLTHPHRLAKLIRPFLHPSDAE